MRLGSLSISRRRAPLSPRGTLAVRLVSAVILVAALAGLAFLGDRLHDRLTLIVDKAGLIGDAGARDIEAHHHYLRLDYGIDYRVVVANATGDINLFAVDRYRALRVGANTQDGRGLLLVIDPAQDDVRLEVGYALEGIFPDAFVAYIQRRQMVPFFQAGRVGDGILATTELIVARAIEAELGADTAGEIWMQGSGGAGAVTDAEIGAGRPRPAAPADGFDAGATPETTLARYFDAMDAHNDNPDLDLYTQATRAMLADWAVTPAQMDSIVATYRDCRAEAARVDDTGDLAVIRYPPEQRRCAPFFFRRSAGDWRLDLTMMQTAIRFGRTNAWRLLPGKAHPYGFAFADWRFDRNGFPRP